MTLILAACAALLLSAALASLLAGATFASDLLANLASHWSALAGALAVGAFLLRRGGSAIVLLAACAIGVGHVVVVPRAERAARDRPSVRVLVFNTGSLVRETQPAIDLIMRVDADFVALPEMSPELIERVEGDGPLRARYPHVWTNGYRNPGHGVALSRWPVAELVAPIPADRPSMMPSGAVYAIRACTPIGEVGLVVAHPRSPKTPALWRNGNEHVSRAIDVLHAASDSGLPLVLATDLNASPTGGRSLRLWRELGLRRAKPMLRLGGTFPAALPGPLRVAIDDAWITPSLAVVSWSTVDGGGSDHAAVLIELAPAYRP